MTEQAANTDTDPATPAEPDAAVSSAGAPSSAGAESGDPWYSRLDGIGDDVRSYLEGKNFPDLGAALQSGMHADKVARDRNVIARPDPENLEGWEGWEALGWKKEAEDYVLERPEIFKDAAPDDYDQGTHDEFARLAHEAHIPVPAAQKLLSGVLDYMKRTGDEQLAAIEREGNQASEALEGKLRDKWGRDFDQKAEQARRAASALAGRVEQIIGTKPSLEDLAALEAAVGSSAGLTAMFQLVGEALGEDSIVTGDMPGGIASPAAARAEIARLKADPEHRTIMSDTRHPKHAAQKARWDQLNEMAARSA